MNILLVSQCDKRALVESRRILDQFAERRGERTWQTPITQAGLDTLRRLLRKTARKNTAVACHWIRGLDHSELLWIVGDATRFNLQGAVPTDTTTRNVLRSDSENDWHTGEDIRLLAALAALLHDIGKASDEFQARLNHRALERNQYRHEWVSLRLFQAFVGDSTDAEWLQRLIEPSAEDDASWIHRLQRDGIDATDPTPFRHMPPLAQAVGWLVLTHHRLPMKPGKDAQGRNVRLGGRIATFGDADNLLLQIQASWNETPTTEDRKTLEPYWRCGRLPTLSTSWRKQAARVAKRLLERHSAQNARNWLENAYVMHLARLSLMLADHHYSTLHEEKDRIKGDKDYPLFANTKPPGEPNQPLDEHLIGVEKHAGIIARALPDFCRALPRLVGHKGLRKRSENEAFRWQDRACDTTAALRERAARQGAFIVNMASTGCGKTLANLRIMNALADPRRGPRCAIALGLRVLTLQTGEALSKRLGLSDDKIGVLTGGAASRELQTFYRRQAASTGSASAQSLLDADSHVYYEGNADDPVLMRTVHDQRARQLLSAPILVCTVDHLAPATEGHRGGRQILPMLRLLSGDLVLDELDDYDVEDLPALTRLVYWAGLLGARVLLSSATLAPALVQGMFLAYQAGRRCFQANRGERPGESASICCAWFDEFEQQALDCGDAQSFDQQHQVFALKRAQHLAGAVVRRRARLVDLRMAPASHEEIRRAVATRMRDEAVALHGEHHSVDPHSGKRVSFGLIRMANIEPIYDVARALYRLGAAPEHQIHLCVYHSQYPLLLRSAIEQQLDAALDRHQENAVFDLPAIRRAIDSHAAQHHLFIVLGSPVTEVGRDHCYDWAIPEPSSLRSLIQLSGRVRRHRGGTCLSPNIAMLSTNVKHLENPSQAAFHRPGFEQDSGPFKLQSHQLTDLLGELLDAEQQCIIDARPRIIEATPLRPQQRLADLEHARLRDKMLPPPQAAPVHPRLANSKSVPRLLNASSVWDRAGIHLTGALQQQQPFRRSSPVVNLMLMPNEDGDDFEIYQIRNDEGGVIKGRRDEKVYVLQERNLVPETEVSGEGICPWVRLDYLELLNEVAEEQELTLAEAALRFGQLDVRPSERGWWFHPALGFSRRR
ncbi:type I-F CRISPR-associated helicase Cas3f [Tahibacter harae]|uniref:Type I-F CRISPR-associated helicase Cas3f n=1 Tax=Tahibacter harae TaxID=2963937 RepID=A0ABT1QYR0_9GAMM|nr:type I-F CRISPR-associated helicase Cas3f [Tahibacter harae]MCQ4167390.1 type I-F CRISPR-associated helicase Cas3f [Tahibacter harae]